MCIDVARLDLLLIPLLYGVIVQVIVEIRIYMSPQV